MGMDGDLFFKNRSEDLFLLNELWICDEQDGLIIISFYWNVIILSQLWGHESKWISIIFSINFRRKCIKLWLSFLAVCNLQPSLQFFMELKKRWTNIWVVCLGHSFTLKLPNNSLFCLWTKGNEELKKCH